MYDDDFDLGIALDLENNQAPGQIETRIRNYRNDGFDSPVRKVIGELNGCADMVRGGHYSTVLDALNHGPDHDFIYLGEDYVVEVPGPGKINKNKIRDRYATQVKHTGLEQRYGSDIGEEEYSEEDVASRAEESVGERWDYHAVRNNCQHFAYWCQTGYFKSRVINGNVDDDDTCQLNKYRELLDGPREAKWRPRFSGKPLGVSL